MNVTPKKIPTPKIPEPVLKDLTSFISKTTSAKSPNSLLIAEAFMLKYPHHGREFGLSEINYIIEDGMERGLF